MPRKSSFFCLLLWIAILLPSGDGIFSQLPILNGNAVQLSTGCYQLTSSAGFSERSAVWFPNQIDLNNPFDISFLVSHENRAIGNNGGDGLAFVLQRDPSGTAAIGETGYAQGFSGFTGGGGNPVSPSFAAELDIWDNTPTLSNEIASDHISLLINGNIDALINGPAVQALPGGANVTSGNCREIRFVWRPAVDSFYVYFNSMIVPRIATQYDIRIPFGINTLVWWGVTAASGGVPIQQVVCFHGNQVGADTTICSDASYQINPSGSVNYTWLPAAGLSCANCPSPTLINPPAGTYTYYTTNNTTLGCLQRDTIVIVAEQTPIADAGSDQTICTGDSIPIGTIASPNYTYSWFPNSDISDAAIAQPTVWPPGVSTSYGVTVVDTSTLMNCSALDIMIVTSIPPPSANAGNDTSICDTFFTLAGNPPAGTGNPIWAVIAGSGSFADPTNPSATVTGLSQGINTLSWTIDNGSCQAIDSINIMVTSVSTPQAGIDSSLCVDTLILYGNSPIGVETGVWSSVMPGPNIINSSQSNATVTNLQPGLNQLVWEFTNGNCARYDTVNVFFVSAQSANAGIDTIVCGTSLQLYGNSLAGGSSGIWTSLAAGPSLLNPTQPNCVVTSLVPGPNFFVWEVSTAGCNASDTIEVTAFSFIVATAGPDSIICSDSVLLYANIPGAGQGVWTAFPTAGFSFSDSLQANSIVYFPGQDSGSFIWTITNGPCTHSDTVNIQSLFVTANAGPDEQICGNRTVMSGTAPLSGLGTWTHSGGATFSNVNDPLAIVSNLGWGTNVLVWTVNDAQCLAYDTTYIETFQNPVPADAGPDQSITGTPDATLAGNIPPYGTGAWTSLTVGPQVTAPGNPSSGVTGLISGDNFFQWTLSNGPCPAVSDQMVIHFLELIIPTGFSPNGDGMNDNFEIFGLNNNLQVTLEVFNRWGNEVFASSNYQNDWNGVNSNGDPLADDTYYLVITLGENEPYKGYVVIKR